MRLPHGAVLLHGGSKVGGWTAKQIRETYGLSQLRYDHHKLKGHGLLERDGRRQPGEFSNRIPILT
jgi:hypothetical protein